MAVIIRYQDTIKGALSITGNTLGIAGFYAGDGVRNFTTGAIPTSISIGRCLNIVEWL